MTYQFLTDEKIGQLSDWFKEKEDSENSVHVYTDIIQDKPLFHYQIKKFQFFIG